MNTKDYLGRIEKELTSKISSYNEVHQGTFNLVFEVNEQWIFRFTREKAHMKQLEVEMNFLSTFLNVSPINIPHIEFADIDFIGYKKIQGVPLTNDVLSTLDKRQRDALWESLGRFLTVLHSSSFTHEHLSAFPYGGADFWDDVWSPVKDDLSVAARDRAEKYFFSYFQEEQHEETEKTICHGDLHPNHILYDTKTQSICGIIDFGNICNNDPAIDFNLFERIYGNEAVSAIMKHYKRKTGPRFRKRITFQNRRRLFDAIFRARTLGYDYEVPRYIQRIEDVFKDTNS